ncbi:MAG TPA: pantetheine-phosphate adenylyltransferase, partial [Phycisphaerae bacterium]|nr:pantetheine-phosphate adenylyltransferase [Phycisphaerae bacterium]HQL76397.1 pantetheine-phosphate adenylyltransferase [Phycisphaerae bacterium]
MTDRPPRLGLFPGTFDPITNGHLDIIRRGRGLFDQLVVAVGDNPEKHSLLNADERAAIIREVVADMDNVRVEIFTGLTVDLARRLGATAILRGLRNTTDLHFEFQVALTNRVVAGIETVFVITASEWAFTSSSLIRQIARMGGDVSAMVPPQVL